MAKPRPLSLADGGGQAGPPDQPRQPEQMKTKVYLNTHEGKQTTCILNADAFRSAAPVRKVLMIHDACRDQTQGLPFTVVRVEEIMTT